MRIVQITAGTGDSFYCENCLRDSVLARQMIEDGHEVLIIPLYLPLGIDASERPDDDQIFFGGINVYLQQNSAIFRRTPRWLDRLFDSPRLLKWAGRRMGMTSARQLGRTIISMLRGQEGRQRKELHRLLSWLSGQPSRPDVVLLPNILLSGLAEPIKDELSVPVVSLLQDEDSFLDSLPVPQSQQAWELVGELCDHLDAFVSVSNYYARLMQERLGLKDHRMHIVPPGIKPKRYQPLGAPPPIPTIGYLSRMCPDRGLDTLVDAFVILKGRDDPKNVRLRIAGGATINDRVFVEQIKQILRSRGLLSDVEFLPDFDWPERADFLNSLSLLCVPEKHAVAGGLYVLEAWASAVPVIEPDIGAFSELINNTNGGLLYEPGNVQDLAETLHRLLVDPQRALTLGKSGLNTVCRQYNIERTVRQMAAVFEQVVSRNNRGQKCSN